MLLYKYRSIDKFSKRILTNGEIYFAHPDEFNDPFDCAIPLSLDGSEQDVQKYFSEKLKNSHPNLSPSKRISASRKQAARHKTNPIKSDGLREIPLGIFCMTKNPENILMWSHYADSHQGMCIGFNERLFNEVFEVIYSDNFPSPSLLDNTEESLSQAYRNKAKDWAYEQEYRAISKPSVQKIYEHHIQEIVFGLSTDPKEKEEILEIVLSRKLSVKLTQIKKVPKQFKLTREPIQLPS